MGKLALTGNSRVRKRYADLPEAAGGGGVFTDDFNRSNRALNGDNGWNANTNGAGAIDIVSNVVVCSNSVNGAWMTNTGGGVSATDHYAEIEITAGLAGDIGGAINRHTSVNTFYVGRCSRAGSDTYELYKRVAGTYTLLGSLAQAFPAEPFRIRQQVIGTALKLQLWNGSAWVDKVTATDAAIASGAPGFFSQTIAGNVSYDNYAHGNT